MAPETIDSLDTDAKPLVLALIEQNGEFIEQIKSQGERIDKLMARIAELEAKLGKPEKTPDNSSLPPSSGKKANVAAPAAAKPKRRSRPGVARTLCESPDETREVYAEGTIFHGARQPSQVVSKPSRSPRSFLFHPQFEIRPSTILKKTSGEFLTSCPAQD